MRISPYVGRQYSRKVKNYNLKNVDQLVFDARNYQFTGKAFGGMTEGVAADGGNTVPSLMANYFIDLIATKQTTRNIVKTIPVSGKTFEIPKLTAGDTVYLGGEGKHMLTEGGADQASSSMTKPTWGKITVTPQKLIGLTAFSTELEEDSALNIAQIAIEKLLYALSQWEEKAFIQGEANGTKFSWTAGDPRYAWDGFIDAIPGTELGTGSNWTPDDSSPSNWIDGGSNVLTKSELDQLLAKIEDQGGVCDAIYVTPVVQARMRDKSEFDIFQGLDKIGADAALIKGFVGRFYTANIYVNSHVPVGTTFGTNTDDAVVIGFDTTSPFIGDRRTITINERYEFYSDVIELQFTERLDFKFEHNELLAGIADVKNAVV
ncbi:MAG: phage major capsid protein [Candidatus Nanoarchaeia archaeon]